jgi:hypothetical protein
MMEWMELLSAEEVRRINLVSEALKWTPERVMKTPFTIIIRELAVKVLELRTDKDYSEHVLETIEKFLEEKRK